MVDLTFKRVKRLPSDTDGATAIEYGLIIGLIALGILVALSSLSDGVNGLFDTVATETGDAIAGATN